MPYRINAYVPPPEPSFWDIYSERIYEGSVKLGLIVFVLLIAVGFWAGIAAAFQWLITGMVGHPVGTFIHYFVGVFLFDWMLRRTHVKVEK